MTAEEAAAILGPDLVAEIHTSYTAPQPRSVQRIELLAALLADPLTADHARSA